MTEGILVNGHVFATWKNGERCLKFQWGVVNGPEAEVGSREHACLRVFIYDLCFRILQDYAIVTPSELRLQLAEGEFQDQDDEEEFEPHWEVSLTSSKFPDLESEECLVLMMLGELKYFARLPRRPEEDYHGVFRVRLEMVCGERFQDDYESMNQLFRLICGAYQQEICKHYPEWETDYQPIPVPK